MEGVNADAVKSLNGVFVPQSEDRDVLAFTLVSNPLWAARGTTTSTPSTPHLSQPNGLKALVISDPSTDMGKRVCPATPWW